MNSFGSGVVRRLTFTSLSIIDWMISVTLVMIARLVGMSTHESCIRASRVEVTYTTASAEKLT